MRNAVGIFGLFCGLIVIGLVGRYGYKTTETEADALIMAFLFAAIAAGGLFGHAVSVRLWKLSKPAAVAVGIVCAAALLLNLSNSLGAIAGRSDAVTIKQIGTNRVIDAAEAEHDRLDRLRDEMAAFTYTDDAAVEAARQASMTAAENKLAECDKRGPNCRQREIDAQAAADRLTAATASHSATNRARQLEADAKVQRDKLTELGTKREINVQGAALARLFRLPDSEAAFAAVAQQFGIAVVVELIIVMCLIAWEILRHEPHAVCELLTPAIVEESAIGVVAVTVMSPPRQKLIPAPERPSQQVMRIMADALEPAPGMTVALDSGYRRYAAICAAEGIEPVLPEAYLDAMVDFCRAVGLATRSRKGRVHLVNVALAKPA